MLAPPGCRTIETELFGTRLDAAEEVYAERGLDGASVRMLTQRAGARLGAITELFGGLNALPRAVIERRHGELLAARRARWDAHPKPGLAQIIEAYALPLIERARADAGWKAAARHLELGGKGWRDYARMFTTAINSQGQQWLDALDASHTSVTRSMVEAAAIAQPGMTLEDACYAHLFLNGSLSICYSTEDRMRRLSGGAIQPDDYREAYSQLLHFHTGGSLALASRATQSAKNTARR